MRKPRARWAAIGCAAQLLLSAACGGGTSPPREPTGRGEIDLTRGSGATNGAFGLAEPVVVPGDAALQSSVAEPTGDVAAVRLDAARVPVVPDSSPSRGPADAPVVVQLFSDFECPFCARALPAIAELERRSAGAVRLVWRNYPLPSHRYARVAARAALEALSQRGTAAFWTMHDRIYESAQSGLDEQVLERLARELELDLPRFRAALRDTRHDPAIDRDITAGDSAGIEGTPAFLINDYYLMGLSTPDAFEAVVQQARRDRRSPPP